MPINFSGSIEKKEGFLTHIAKSKMKTEVSVFSKKKQQQAMKIIERMETDYEFYSDEVQKSKTLPENYFTNFLNNSTSHEVTGGVYSVFTDRRIVDTLKGDYVRFNSKIKNCLIMYYPSLTDETEVFKSNLQDIAGKPRPVRIFSIADLDFAQRKFTFKIILIDPFHLVIPSEFGKMNNREMEQKVYSDNARNDICMSAFVEDMQSQR